MIHIKDFSKNGSLSLNESPWSPDDKQFVYTIRSKSRLFVNGQNSITTESNPDVYGSYIFDIENARDIKFIPESYNAVWSPVTTVIAYTKKDMIWLYDVEKDLHRLLFKLKQKDEMQNIHWSPKGDHLLVRLLNKKRDQIMIRVSDGKEVPFINLPVAADAYTWR